MRGLYLLGSAFVVERIMNTLTAADLVFSVVILLLPSGYLVARHPASLAHVLLAAIVGGMLCFPLPFLWLVAHPAGDTGPVLFVSVATPLAGLAGVVAGALLESVAELSIRAYLRAKRKVEERHNITS